MLPRMRLRRASTECLLAGTPALLIFIWWITREGGYFERSWMPGAVLLTAVGAASAIALRGELSLPSRPARIAVAAFGAYVAWSFLSILWAGTPGDALEGSQRALLYLACFTLFVLLPWTPRTLLVALLAFVATMTLVGAVTVLRLAGDVPLADLFIDARLRAPVGYHNAAAALWTMAAVPALVLSARSELPLWLRPLLLAAATLLLGLAVLCQSRGWLYTLPLILLAALLLSPERLKLIAFAAFCLGEVAIAAPTLLAVNGEGAGLEPGLVEDSLRPVLDAAVVTLVACTAGALVAGIALVYAERVLRGRFALRARSRRLAGVALVAAVVVGAAGAVTVAAHGDPVTRVKSAWTQFTAVDAAEPVEGETHLTTLGSTRYDFWRVALDAWRAHPVAGLGQDNFAEYYARHRASSFEEPRWVHSLPLRLLAHTGIVGAALLLAFLAAIGAGVLCVWRGARDPATRAAVGAAVLPAVVWAAHGSVDWLWEFPALSTAALAFAGGALALGRPAHADPDAEPQPARSARAQRAIGVGAIVALVGVTALIVPSLIADSEVSRAARDWRADPARAIDRLERARTLNPLAARPSLVEGEIHARRGALSAAQAAFARASEKQPDAWYPYFARGLLAGSAGDSTAARRWLLAAQERNPRDPLVADALSRVGTRPVTFDEAQRSLRERLDLRRNVTP